jgi:hypothetical protein
MSFSLFQLDKNAHSSPLLVGAEHSRAAIARAFHLFAPRQMQHGHTAFNRRVLRKDAPHFPKGKWIFFIFIKRFIRAYLSRFMASQFSMVLGNESLFIETAEYDINYF